jgi:glycerol-3-phosphate acyltransferase PlsY
MTMPTGSDALAIAIGYFSGSVPFAQLVSRRRGIDLRRVGSGNVGASNVLRTSGVRQAVLAMCLDGIKGALAVLIAARLTSGPLAPVAAGVASVIGHVYPVWLRFRGGKGVATAAGVFAVLAPWPLVGACAVFLLCVWVTRYISVGSLAATLALAGMSTVEDNPLVPIGAAVSALVIVLRHRPNLTRLFAGTERRVGQRLGDQPASELSH